jgi:transposase
VEYGRYANESEYVIFAQEIIDEIIDKTFRDGFFTINEFQKGVYAHPHCYATEGLCFLHSKGYSKYSDIIKKSSQWLSEAQNDDGSLSSWHYDNNAKVEKQGDATAQAVRIWLFEDRNKYKDNIDKALSFLKTLQSPEGGMYYNNNSKDVNSWVSMFASQALYWSVNNRVDFDWIV